MKKIFVAFILMITICVVVGCGETKPIQIAKNHPSDTDSSTSMFVLVETTDIWRVVYQKETKVMYVVSGGYYNTGVFTILLDETGLPMLYDESVGER